MTVGPWRPISIEYYNTRITDVFTKVDVDIGLAVKIAVSFSISEDSPVNASITFEALDGSTIISSQSLQITGGTGEAIFSFKKGEIDLWYPIGYGKQSRYAIQVQITDAVS